MKTIWKFKLAIGYSQVIKMPKGAEILTIQMQGINLCLWALVDPEKETKVRTIETHDTGNSMPEVDLLKTARKYIATVQDSGTGEVWHFFERM